MEGKNFEFPEDLKQEYAKAKKLEWITIIYLISAIVLMYFVLGGSQAMKTAWIDDMLSLIPPIVLLISSKIFNKGPNRNHPYGYHRIISITFLTAAVALSAVGLLLVYDATLVLIKKEYPTIQTIQLFGKDIWLGWPMIGALIYSALPAAILSRMKMPIAEKLHDKNLFTDADMGKADWLSASAAIGGILGIAFGLWWADAVAALIISIDITKDGISNLKTAILDLMNRIPMTVDRKKVSPKMQRLEEYLKASNNIKDHFIRLREEGHVYFGEIFVVMKESDEEKTLEKMKQEIQDLDWQFFDITIMPVRTISKNL